MFFVTVIHGPIVESHERQLPGITYRNPSATIPTEPFMLGIIAALLHPIPNMINPCIPLPMCNPSVIALDYLIPCEAATTLARPSFEIILADLFDSPTGAFTLN